MSALNAAEIEGGIAEQPKFTIGDSWTFKRTSNGADAPDAWLRTVAALPSPDRVKMRLGNGTLYLTDAALNRVSQDPDTGHVVFVKNPLRVGNRTTFEQKFSNPSESNYGSSEVLAFESVSVPAGTFECFRVKTETTYSRKTKFVVQRTWVRWYCPAIEWFARQEYEERTTVSYNPAGNQFKKQTSELVKFVAGEP